MLWGRYPGPWSWGLPAGWQAGYLLWSPAESPCLKGTARGPDLEVGSRSSELDHDLVKGTRRAVEACCSSNPAEQHEATQLPAEGPLHVLQTQLKHVWNFKPTQQPTLPERQSEQKFRD